MFSWWLSLAVSRQIQKTTNCRRQFAWNNKSYFAGKIGKVFSNALSSMQNNKCAASRKMEPCSTCYRKPRDRLGLATRIGRQIHISPWLLSQSQLKYGHVDVYSRLSLSRTPRDSMKHFEISVVRHIRFTELRKKQLIEQPPLTEWIRNLTPKLEIYWKYCGKEEKLLLRSNFSSFPQYFVAFW